MTHGQAIKRYLSDKEAASFFGVSRATIWRWVQERGFPNPVRLSPGCTRWKLADIEAWDAAAEGK